MLWLAHPLPLTIIAFSLALLGRFVLKVDGPTIWALAAAAPLAALTATIWWRIWEHDALFAVTYTVALAWTGSGAAIGVGLGILCRRAWRMRTDQR